LIAYYAVTGWDNLFAAVYSFLLILRPLAINALIAFFTKTRASQVVLLCTAIAYTAWAFSLFMDVSSSSDGQAGLALLLTAIAASPVLLIAWIACLVIEIIQRKKGHRHGEPQTMVA
jgi:hypothetical protein